MKGTGKGCGGFGKEVGEAQQLSGVLKGFPPSLIAHQACTFNHPTKKTLPFLNPVPWLAVSKP